MQIAYAVLSDEPETLDRMAEDDPEHPGHLSGDRSAGESRTPHKERER